jgi:tetratricopeptide (TPR) repeat protein
MSVLRGPVARGVLLAAGIALTGAGMASAACTGPPELTAKLSANPNTENAIELGNWFASKKQFDCAAETFHAALNTDPQSAQLYYLDGLALIGAGKSADALPVLQQAEGLQPEVILPHLMLAYVYNQAGQHDQAVEEWKLALKIDPQSEQALEGLSADLLAQKDYIGVVGLLRTAPRTEKLAINLSQALGLLNYLDEAKAVLGEAFKLSPNSVPLASAITVVLVKQLRYQEGIHQPHHPGATDGSQTARRAPQRPRSTLSERDCGTHGRRISPGQGLSGAGRCYRTGLLQLTL